MSDEETLEQVKTELEQVRAALKKANEEAAQHRHEAKEAKEALESTSSYRDKYMQAKVEGLLAAKGIKNPERLLGLVDLKDAEDDDSIKERVDALEESLPEIFDPKTRAGSNSIDASDQGDPSVERTPSEKQALQLLHGTG